MHDFIKKCAGTTGQLTREKNLTNRRVKGSGLVGTKVNNLKDKKGHVSLTLKWQELFQTGCDITESLYKVNQQELRHQTLISTSSIF